MRLAIVTDTWVPQVNGVVRTLDVITKLLAESGDMVEVIHPARFRTIPCPTYPEMALSVDAFTKIPAVIREFEPDAIHIATEGPLGLAARRYCLVRGLPFTTAYHTKFPEYIHARCRLPLSTSYKFLRRFHRAATRTMVSTPSLERDLSARGFTNLVRWTRGVDCELFKPRRKIVYTLPRPIFLYVGRVAMEKNLHAFIDAQLPGSKVVIGGGPQLKSLRRANPKIAFLGPKFGSELAEHYASADVFVFPSLTDTFGLVLLEALASGLPIAAFPVTGPRDIIDAGPVGVLDNDLAGAAMAALEIPPENCRRFALRHTWQESARQFRENLAPLTASTLADWDNRPPISPPLAQRPQRNRSIALD